MIAALVSASVALLIFAWTQWVTGLRSRHDLLRLKLEELCKCIANLRGRIIKATKTHFPDNVDNQKEVLALINQGIVDDIITIHMLCSLYFPMLRDRVSVFAQAAESTIGSREFFEGYQGKVTSLQILVDSAAFHSLGPKIHELLSYINLEYANLTETPTSRLWSMLSRVFR